MSCAIIERVKLNNKKNHGENPDNRSTVFSRAAAAAAE